MPWLDAVGSGIPSKSMRGHTSAFPACTSLSKAAGLSDCFHRTVKENWVFLCWLASCGPKYSDNNAQEEPAKVLSYLMPHEPQLAADASAGLLKWKFCGDAPEGFSIVYKRLARIRMTVLIWLYLPGFNFFFFLQHSTSLFLSLTHDRFWFINFFVVNFLQENLEQCSQENSRKG